MSNVIDSINRNDSNDSNSRCCYVLRCGKNRGTQCVNKISKKDPSRSKCWTHSHRCLDGSQPTVPIKSPIEEESKVQHLPITDDKASVCGDQKERDDASERERVIKVYEYRFETEIRQQHRDIGYQMWKAERMLRCL